MWRRWVLLLLVPFVVVFFFTVQPASVSNGLSKRVSQLLVERGIDFGVVADVGSPTAAELRRVNSVLRGYAHMILYSVVTFFVAVGLFFWGMRLRRTLWQTFLAIGVLAAVDEWVQGFIPGRSTQLSDWLMDMFGASVALGIFVVLVVVWRVGRWGVDGVRGIFKG